MIFRLPSWSFQDLFLISWIPFLPWLVAGPEFFPALSWMVKGELSTVTTLFNRFLLLFNKNEQEQWQFAILSISFRCQLFSGTENDTSWKEVALNCEYVLANSSWPSIHTLTNWPLYWAWSTTTYSLARSQVAGVVLTTIYSIPGCCFAAARRIKKWLIRTTEPTILVGMLATRSGISIDQKEWLSSIIWTQPLNAFLIG